MVTNSCLDSLRDIEYPYLSPMSNIASMEVMTFSPVRTSISASTAQTPNVQYAKGPCGFSWGENLGSQINTHNYI